jgi:hypothetical protein
VTGTTTVQKQDNKMQRSRQSLNNIHMVHVLVVEIELKRCVGVTLLRWSVSVAPLGFTQQLVPVIVDVCAKNFKGPGYGDWSANDD